MMVERGDAKLEALDEVEAALRKIYDAKRDGTATAQDDIRLKKLHIEWMAVMRKIGGAGEDPPRLAMVRATQNAGDDSGAFMARLRGRSL
jgi:hypothetical protein